MCACVRRKGWRGGSGKREICEEMLVGCEQCKFDKIGIWTLKSLLQRRVHHVHCVLVVCTVYHRITWTCSEQQHNPKSSKMSDRVVVCRVPMSADGYTAKSEQRYNENCNMQHAAAAAFCFWHFRGRARARTKYKTINIADIEIVVPALHYTTTPPATWFECFVQAYYVFRTERNFSLIY